MLRISGLPVGFKENDLHDFFRHCNIKIKIIEANSKAGVADVEVENHEALNIIDELRKKKFKGQYSLTFKAHPVINGATSYEGTLINQPEIVGD